jgi:2-dehydropantoate 2-reductase
MRIVVIGAGAIGGFVGGKLAASGQDVTFVDRPPFVEAVRANGLRIIEPDNTTTIQAQAVTDLSQAFDSASPADLVLVCVKTFHTQTVIDDLRPFASRFRLIASFQNGISNDELLMQAFGPGQVIAATITHPVVVPELGAVRSEKKQGGIGIAPIISQSVESLVERFNQAGILTQAYADYRAMRWSKLLLNIIGNATSAILNMSTARVFNDRRLVWLEVTQLREAIAVMDKLEVQPVSLPGYPVPLLVLALRLFPTALLGLVMRPLVVKGRAEKLPSLLIELNRGSYLSEVDEINGAVARAGQAAGVPTPVNSVLTATLNLLTNNPTMREAWHYNVERLVLVARGAQKKLPAA